MSGGWKAERKMRTTLDFGGQGTATGLRAPVQPTDAAPRQWVLDVASGAVDPTPTDDDPGDLTVIFDNALL